MDDHSPRVRRSSSFSSLFPSQSARGPGMGVVFCRRRDYSAEEATIGEKTIEFPVAVFSNGNPQCKGQNRRIVLTMRLLHVCGCEESMIHGIFKALPFKWMAKFVWLRKPYRQVIFNSDSIYASEQSVNASQKQYMQFVCVFYQSKAIHAIRVRLVAVGIMGRFFFWGRSKLW